MGKHYIFVFTDDDHCWLLHLALVTQNMLTRRYAPLKDNPFKGLIFN